jgi:hypothetical protein
MSRGRKPFHVTNPESVEQIKWFYQNTSMSITAIARRFGIGYNTASKYCKLESRTPPRTEHPRLSHNQYIIRRAPELDKFA